MTDLAIIYGVDVGTLQSWFTLDHWIELFRLGYRPYLRLLPPGVVRYIRDVIVNDTYLDV